MTPTHYESFPVFKSSVEVLAGAVKVRRRRHCNRLCMYIRTHIRLRFFYSKLWSYTIANWCFSSSNILSVTTLTQLNSAVCLEHPNLRDNSFLWSCRQSWMWEERAWPPPPRVVVASSPRPSSRHCVMLGWGQSFAWAIKLKEINIINSYCCIYNT